MSTCQLQSQPLSLTRHNSLLPKSRPDRLDVWLEEQHCRSLSVPDLNKLGKEWDTYQQSDASAQNRIIDTKMQVDLLNIRMDSPLRRPQMRLKMGPAQYLSKKSSSSTGEWNEGFVFVVSYHAQLFNTIELDLYDQPRKHWPTTRHVGKAKLKISTLSGKSDIFVTFLPIYEYRPNRMLPTEVQPTLLKTQVVDPTTVSKKTGDQHLIGSVQVRIRYHFQQPWSERESIPNKRLVSLPLPSPSTSDQAHPLLAPEQDNLLHPLQLTASHASSLTRISTNHSDRQRRSSYGRSDLAQEEDYVNGVFRDRLEKIMTATIPNSSQSTLASSRSSSTNSSSTNQVKWSKRLHLSRKSSSLSAKRFHSVHHPKQQSHLQRVRQLMSPAKMIPKSSSGRRFGFSQHDSDDNRTFNPDNERSDAESSSSSLTSSAPMHDKIAHGARKKAQHIIDGVNFGDRDFATQWMQDSFEDVALSHPMVDKLIGLVVSKQTQAMVRAIIKTANSFGQGFRVNGAKLLKAAMLIQRFYESLPRPPDLKPIEDMDLIGNACHYVSFALIAYGWRGLCYMGLYSQYIRGARDRHSNRLAIIKYLGLHPEDLLGYEYALRKGASFQPSYFVALDRPRRAIVLSIRGTWSLYDAITDLVCEYMPWKNGLVHSGMLASAQWFYTNIIPQIFRYIHHHNSELDNFIITGHSLGGGTASLLTMMVADHIDELRELADNPSFNMHCYNYAPAAVSSPDLCKRYEKYIHSFVCQDDVVGRLSYGTAMKLKELALDMISAYNTLGGFRKTMTDPKTRKVCFDIIAQRRDKLNNVAASMYPSLYIPGEIIQIRRDKEARFGKYEGDGDSEQRRGSAVVADMLSRHPIPGTNKTCFSLHYSTHEISSEMKLTRTCIEDHMISAYNDAFEGLKEQYQL